MSGQFSYDRTSDVPKIIGCNTRNIEYRWSIFERAIRSLKKPSRVLDFGAGSLRETFYLSERGHRVTSVDLDISRMRVFASKYTWSGIEFEPELTTNIPGDVSFDLITAFDVVEHIANLDDSLPVFYRALVPGGMVLCTVPNRRTLIEIVNKRMLARGKQLPPGEAHLQFKSPAEWSEAFRSYGFDVVEHDMAIGPFANTWYWSIYLASRVGDHLNQRVGYAMRWLLRPKIIRGFDRIDRLFGKSLFGIYGWNLIVLRKPGQI